MILLKPRHPQLRLPNMLLTLIALLLALAPATPPARAAPTSGGLRIEPMAAYNFIVDSNVESPSTYAPEAGSLAAKVCNDGASTLTDLFIYIGDYNSVLPASSTPGVYPAKTQAPYVGTFSLTHEGGSAGAADATRYIASLAAGQCVTQYWLVSYPRLDSGGNSVTGGIKPDDDLFLFYDMWASASEGGTPRAVDVTRRVTMRSEISAAANKIWPNGTNKVPQQYLDAIATAGGWLTTGPGSAGNPAYPGQVARTDGIWYDLGNVGFGFDNNGDGAPDQNAWLQPIGDPNSYDPGCFRLVRSYGLLVVKLVGGGEQLISFVDQLYFEAIPANTGVVGLVFYEYAALDGACSAGLSPYQEVASGFDNEKFSGDYGFSIPPLQSREPSFTLTKTVNLTSIPATPSTALTYSINFANTSPVSIGDPALGTPLVISDAIPAGTDYRAGSASPAGTAVGGGVQVARVLFSSNSGLSWSASEPAAASVTNIQWWFNAPYPASASGNLAFQVNAPVAPPAVTTISVIPNIAGAGFGNAPPFITSTVTTLVQGPNSLSGNVFRDNGAGGLFGNSIYDSASGETLLPNVTVTLYRDSDGDGVIDVGEPLIATTAATYTGAYSFTSLPDGNYITLVEIADSDITAGWTNTTRTTRTAALDPTSVSGSAVAVTGLNFGFAPALVLDKNLISPTSPLYEGELATFELNVSNRLPGNGGPGTACTYVIPASIAHADNTLVPPGGGATNAQWMNTTRALGLPDSSYATTMMANNSDVLGLSGFNLGDQGGTITSVQYRFYVQETQNFKPTDAFQVQVFSNNVALGAVDSYDGTTFFTGATGTTYTVQKAITGLRAWTWADFANNLTEFQVTGNRGGGGGSDGDAGLDSAQYIVTTDQTCGSAATIISTLPLTDTFDSARLQFVSATPAPDSTAPIGTLAWNNVGPLYPGQTKRINVTYRVLTPASEGQSTTNFAGTTGARFANGRAANSALDNVPVTINQDGSISGRVFGDVAPTGWTASTGDGPGDIGIPGVTMELFGCVNTSTGLLYTSGGTNPAIATADCVGQSAGASAWSLRASTVTDSSGNYSFTGLRPGFYLVQVADGTAVVAGGVATSTLPAGATQVAEASDSQTVNGGATCGTCNGLWGADSGTAGRLSASNFNPVDSVNEVIANVDFGYSTTTLLYGNVWQDDNGDGSRASSDGGIGSVTVTLRNCGTNNICGDGDDSTITDTTDANGNYSFGGLTVGRNYQLTVLTVSLPAGATWTETAESDGTITNLISPLAIVAGSSSGSHDFGFTRSGAFSIGDTLYYDWDADATQDAGDEGIANVNVFLYSDEDGDGLIDAGVDTLLATQVTGTNGTYSFVSRPNGSYIVMVDSADPQFPASYPQTQDPDEGGVCTSCDSRSTETIGGANVTTADFGYRPNGVANIGDTVWFDRNGDGVQSGNQEIGLAGVTVNLQVDLNGDGTFVTVRSATTNADGSYLFTNLPAATYRVVVDSADPDIPNGPLGSNYSPTTATTITVNLASSDVLSADFGFAPLGAIGDTIFWDSNRNGGQDLAEPGINGVTVNLYRDTNNNNLYDPGTDTLVATTVTATSSGDPGKYLFSGLPAGEYVVVVDGASAPISGRPQTSDPDRDGTPCATADPGYSACNNQTPVTLYTGTISMGADFGYQPVGVLGDTLWIDADNDGVRDSNEAGLPYVTVNISGPGCAPCTTETDANGEYLFINLGDGSYSVTVDSADPDFTRRSAVGLVPSYDPDGTPNGTTTAVLAGGVVTQMGGAACPGAAGSCDLNADFGYRFFDPAGFDLSGTLCLDNPSPNGLCGPGASGVDGNESPFGGETVFLYRWSDDGDGVLESGETVLAGVTTTSSTTGDYAFTDLPAASGNERYLVSLAAPSANLSLTTTLAGLPDAVVRSQNVAGYTESAYRAFNLASDRTNLDFAFSSTLSYDFGDLPASYSTTLQGAPDGARSVVSPSLYLGATPPDAETNGTPTVGATGDGADEDGVAVPTARWLNGADGGSVNVTVNGTGWLVAWIDFDRDGNFNDASDLVISQAVSSGMGNYLIDVPAAYFPVGSGTPINLAARFRLFSAQPGLPSLAYSGASGAGEVEDYILSFTPTPVTLTSFTAARMGADTRLAWATSSELDVAGYHLLRSASGKRADAQRITNTLIPAIGDSVAGGRYSFTDPAAPQGASYWLEVIHSGGEAEEYGPVSTTPGTAGRTTVYLPLVTR